MKISNHEIYDFRNSSKTTTYDGLLTSEVIKYNAEMIINEEAENDCE
jgi:uncharacterized protein YifN (PemK superfamily)